MAEVRSQRKEATKMAIKLQDAMDAIVMQKEESVALADEGDIAANKGCITLSENSAMLEQTQKPLCPESDMVQGEACAILQNDIVDVNALEEKHPSLEDDGVDKPTPNHANNVLEGEDVSSVHPCKEDLNQQEEAGHGLGCIEPCIQGAKTEYNVEQDNAVQEASFVLGENAASDASHATEEERKNGIDGLHLENDVKVDQDICVGDAQACYAPMARTPSTQQDNAILNQLSEDCRQLKSLVGKLLLQNKAQSNILYTLAERLETLEHQEQRKGQEDRQKLLRKKRKPTKGSKRSMKCRNWECY